MSSMKRKRPHPLVLNCVSGSFEDKSNDFLCPICFEVIEEANVTKCGHTFCFKCISMSLERSNRCPKCNFIVEQVFPNFLLNELITKHHKIVLQKKIDSSGKNNPREMSELQEILIQKSDQLDLSDVNLLLESLAQRKSQLESSCKVIENELLKDFLLQVRNHKQEQLDQLTREISLIDEDCRRVDDLIANEAINKLNLNNNLDNNSNNADSSSIFDREVWPSPEPSSSSSASAFASHDNTTAFNKSNLLAGDVREPWLTSSLNSRRKKMNFNFEDLEQCYFTTRAKSLVLSSSDDDTSVDGLHEFSDTLNKFTSFSSLRPLATLGYASDIFTGSSIVSSIEFDKESEYFAIAGVTKKIKVFEYAAVVKDTLDIHYPVNEMECTSKISCVSWSSYFKAMMASSDYEGTVTIWDAFTGQKVRTYQEHEKRCWSVDFNKVDTKLVASGSDDAKVKLWASNQENSITSLEAKANVCSVKFNPCSRYHLAFGSADHCVHYYDLRHTKNPLMVFKGHKKAVSYVKFLNKEEIVSASTDSQLKLWSTEKTPTVRSFKGHINEKNFVGLATDGDFIACGSENNALFVYYKGLSKQVLTFWFDSIRVLDRDKREDDTSDFVSAVCWRAGSNVVVAANSQGTIKILELV